MAVANSGSISVTNASITVTFAYAGSILTGVNSYCIIRGDVSSWKKEPESLATLW